MVQIAVVRHVPEWVSIVCLECSQQRLYLRKAHWKRCKGIGSHTLAAGLRLGPCFGHTLAH